MSLRDTIDGARREAEGNAAGRPKKEAETVSGEEGAKGFSRRSAAKAKPSREAAASVRTSSKPKQTGLFGGSSETKEEKRERKQRERTESDLRNRAYDLVLRSMDGYRKSEKTFWIVVGAGMACAVVSLACAYAFGQVTDLTTWQGLLSVSTLVAAYALIIGAFIYDLRKRRPYRKQAEARVQGLSEKKLVELFEQERARELERDAKKPKKPKKNAK